MPIVIGIVLSLVVAVFARRVGFDRDRAFYPTVLIVVASYDVLFATINASPSTLLIELIVMAGFAIAAVIGFRSTPWILVAGLAGHGIFDAVHGMIVTNPGMPPWWPAFCAAYDIGAAVWLAWYLVFPVKLAMSGGRPHEQ